MSVLYFSHSGKPLSLFPFNLVTSYPVLETPLKGYLFRENFSPSHIYIEARLPYCCCVVTKLCLTLLQPTRLLCPWDFPGKNAGVGCHFPLLGIFPIQGLNSCRLHWQADSLLLGYQGSPWAFLLPTLILIPLNFNPS